MRCRRASCRWFPRVANASLSRCPFAPPSTPRETRKCLVAPMSDCTTSSGHGADVFPPLEVSHAACVRQSRFRRDVLPTPLFHRPASPVRTAAVRRCFFEGGCTSGRLAQLCSRRALRPRLTPSPPQADVLSGDPGAPAGRGAAHPVPPKTARAGTAAVRTASPAQSRAAALP